MTVGLENLGRKVQTDYYMTALLALAISSRHLVCPRISSQNETCLKSGPYTYDGPYKKNCV